MSRVPTIALLSLRTLARDPFLRLMAVLPVLVALLFRFAVPAADRALAAVVDPTVFRLSTSYPVISAFLVQLAGLFAGGITGFSLLEDRDEGMLTALSVTPLGRGGYLAARLAFPAFLAVLGALLVVPLAGLHRPEAASYLLSVIAVSPLAPVSALLLTGFAADKVEGLAVFKLLGFLYLGPVFVLLPERAQIAGWPLPSYWVTRAYLAGPAVADGAAGVVETAAGGGAGTPLGYAALAVLCSAAYAVAALMRLRRS